MRLAEEVRFRYSAIAQQELVTVTDEKRSEQPANPWLSALGQPALASNEQVEKFQTALNYGTQLSLASKWSEAMQAYRYALDKFPDDLTAILGFARSAFACGQADYAEKAFGQVLERDPANLEALQTLAEIREQRQDMTEAAQLYLKLGDIYAIQADAAAALAAWSQAQALDPNLTEAQDKIENLEQMLDGSSEVQHDLPGWLGGQGSEAQPALMARDSGVTDRAVLPGWLQPDVQRQADEQPLGAAQSQMDAESQSQPEVAVGTDQNSEPADSPEPAALDEPRSGEKIKVLAVDDLPETLDILGRFLTFEPDMVLVGTGTTGPEAIELAESLQPDVILMDINLPELDGIDAVKQIKRILPICQIIMISTSSNAGDIERAKLAGAKEFLMKPFSSTDLLSTIRGLYPPQAPQDASPADDSTPTGKVVSLFSLKGGVGCTTLAVNMAVALQNRGQTSVAVVDANLQAGDVGLMLNLPADQTLTDLVPQADKLAPELIEQVLVSHRSGLTALLAPPRPELAESVTPTLIAEVMTHLRRKFDLIFIDHPSHLDEVSLALLDISDQIVLPVTPELTAIQSTRRFLETARMLDYGPERLMVVLNRAGQSDKIHAETIEQSLNVTLAAQIPFAEETVLPAVNGGSPFVSNDDGSIIAQVVNMLGTLVADAVTA